MNMHITLFIVFFFFNDTATTEIYTLSLHDALPIFWAGWELEGRDGEIEGLICADGMSSEELAKFGVTEFQKIPEEYFEDRKSTRLNSSHSQISYAVFCLKKKKTTKQK